MSLSNPSFHLTSVKQIDSRRASVVGIIAASFGADILLNAVSNVSKSVRAVPGTFVTLASNAATRTVEGIVEMHGETVVLDDSNKDKFRSVSSSMYIDEEERLWSIKRTGAGDILIRANNGNEDEELHTMLKSIASCDHNSLNMRHVQGCLDTSEQVRNSIQGGDLTVYHSSRSGQVELGFVVAAIANADGSDNGVAVVNRLDEDVEHISRYAVVAHVKGDDLETDNDFAESAAFSAVASGAITMDMIADYYRKVFIRNPEYFEKFIERFRQQITA